MSIPPEVIASSPMGFLFTLADILGAAGIPVDQFHSVSLFGGPWQPASGYIQFLNHAVPPILPGSPPEISVAVNNQPAAMLTPQAANGHTVPMAVSNEHDPNVAEPTTLGAEASIYDRIESSWKGCIQMERQMAALRSKLSSMLQGLGKLDRDLAPQERVAADREDRDAWDEVRRWLRDMTAKCHRELKTFDIGMTSGAGKRNELEQIYRTVIEPRTPHNDLEMIRRSFEGHRKEIVNLQRAMGSALQGASTNGTQRANRVLARINKKMLARRAKMREAIGGTNMDKTCRKKR